MLCPIWGCILLIQFGAPGADEVITRHADDIGQSVVTVKTTITTTVTDTVSTMEGFDDDEDASSGDNDGIYDEVVKPAPKAEHIGKSGQPEEAMDAIAAARVIWASALIC